MKPQQAYNSWADQYDSNENKTRDLEAKALRDILSTISFASCLEIGCGTGKNTEWLLQKADNITAVDLSEEMLANAKEKFNPPELNSYKRILTATGISPNRPLTSLVSAWYWSTLKISITFLKKCIRN